MSHINFKIFRSVKKKIKKTPQLKNYHKTMRPPGNVPYIVDNLWEWKRPKKFPNRRRSVFASPTPELALKAAEGGTVYSVKLKGKYKLCQVKGYWDSKKHPDCKDLRNLLLNIFGQAWIDADIKSKEDLGKLWIPCLTRGEMNDLFDSNEKLKEFREEIYNSITYWSDVVLIENGMDLPDPGGEFIFEPFDGYCLEDEDGNDER